MNQQCIVQETAVLDTISVIILDDHPVSADGLRCYLGTDPSIAVVAVCTDGEEALEAVERLSPTLVIIDLALDGSQMDGEEVAGILRQRYPEIKLLVISAYYNVGRVIPALSAGIDGYLIKTSGEQEIIKTIHAIVETDAVVWHPKISQIVQRYLQGKLGKVNQYGSSLTRRELEILELIALDFSTSEIAAKLFIAKSTVKRHIANIFQKLNLSNREQARVYYYYELKQVKD